VGRRVVKVSHHLSVLRHSGLVRGEKQGRFVHYRLAPHLLQPEGESEHLDLGCCRLESPGPSPDPPDHTPPGDASLRITRWSVATAECARCRKQSTACGRQSRSEGG